MRGKGPVDADGTLDDQEPWWHSRLHETASATTERSARMSLRRNSVHTLICGAAAALLATDAGAQLNVQWVTFQQDATRLGTGVTAVSAQTTDVDFATGDLDQDGWIDLVAVRKPPGSTIGKRPNMLLMNEGGVLTDRTAQYASASDVVGDQGLLTPTSARDVQIADLTGDGWLDVITAISLAEGDPKPTSHPRLYVNLGNDASGNWLGLRFENARIPQMLSKTGLQVGPRFIEVSLGDVDLDGDLDMHFVDHDETTTGIGENAAWDYDDRLLINDGNGYFTDGTSARMTNAQVLSEFGTGTRMVDMNADGKLEIVRASANGSPQGVYVEYNDPANAGNFKLYGEQSIPGVASPYAFDVGDLNQDGRPDLVQEDDGQDKYAYNLGQDALHKVTWGPMKNFTYAGANDDGFGGNCYIEDLDLDGWPDALIADIDIDAASCSSRTHIFHNLGGAVGAQVTLKEEAELSSGNMGAGWKGVVGIAANQLNGTYDISLADFDRDGDLDMVIGRCAGAAYWENLTTTNFCQEDLGFGGPGSMALTICGDVLTEPGSSATLELTGAAPNALAYLPIGFTNAPMSAKDGTLVPVPWIVMIMAPTDATGSMTLPIAGSGNPAQTLYLQTVVKNGATWEFSNAVQLVMGL